MEGRRGVTALECRALGVAGAGGGGAGVLPVGSAPRRAEKFSVREKMTPAAAQPPRGGRRS